MMTRRDFLKSGVMYTSCAMLDAAWAQAPAKRRAVVVGGRRVRTIDVHAHVAFPEAVALLGNRGVRTPQATLEELLRRMDAQGIDMEAMSINPNRYAAEGDLAAEVIRIQNERLAELCPTHPTRFNA